MTDATKAQKLNHKRAATPTSPLPEMTEMSDGIDQTKEIAEVARNVADYVTAVW